MRTSPGLRAWKPTRAGEGGDDAAAAVDDNKDFFAVADAGAEEAASAARDLASCAIAALVAP